MLTHDDIKEWDQRITETDPWWMRPAAWVSAGIFSIACWGAAIKLMVDAL